MSIVCPSLSAATSNIPVTRTTPAYCADYTPVTGTPTITVGVVVGSAIITAYAAGFGIGHAVR